MRASIYVEEPTVSIHFYKMTPAQANHLVHLLQRTASDIHGDYAGPEADEFSMRITAAMAMLTPNLRAVVIEGAGNASAPFRTTPEQ